MTALVRIVLIDPSHPGNIGSVARAMKNMALSDLALVQAAIVPARRVERARCRRGRHPARRARRRYGGRGDRRLRLRRRDDLAPALLSLGIHHSARRWRRASPALAGREPRGAVVRLRALRARHRGFALLQCAGAHSGQSGLLLAQSGDVGAAARVRDIRGARAAQVARAIGDAARRRRATSNTSTRICTRCSTKSISTTAPGT